jgi:DNA-binding MarR family transcriptional regulator
MLRQHIFSSLATVEDRNRKCGQGDLSLAQLNLLLAVRARGEVAVTELAGMLSVSPPSVSVMADRLVERGLLNRERAATGDRRRVVIRISAEAEQYIGEMEERMVASFVQLVEEVGAETAEKWYQVLQHVEDVLKKSRGDGLPPANPEEEPCQIIPSGREAGQ